LGYEIVIVAKIGKFGSIGIIGYIFYLMTLLLIYENGEKYILKPRKQVHQCVMTSILCRLVG